MSGRHFLFLLSGVAWASTGAPGADGEKTDPALAAVESAYSAKRIDLLETSLRGFDVNRPLFEDVRKRSRALPYSKSLLVHAAGDGWTSAVRLALKCGADLERDGYLALFHAVVADRLATVEFLLGTGVKPFEAVGDLRYNALPAALDNGARIEIIEALDAAGAPMADLRETMVRRAYNRGVPAVNQWLESRGVAIPDATDGDRFIRAIREKNVTMLIDASKDPYLPKTVVNHAETIAAAAGSLGLLKSLFARNRNARSKYPISPGNSLRQTPLWFAAARGDVAMAEFLIGQGVEVDYRTFSRQTPLMVACDLGHLAAARLLLEKGANIQAKDARSWTALDFARRSGSAKMIGLIESKGGLSDFPEGRRPDPPESAYFEKKSIALEAFPAKSPPRSVALARIAVRDAHYGSLTTSDALWDAVQPELQGIADLTWVERQKLEQITGEWTLNAIAGRGSGTSLMAGRLAGADWIVTANVTPDQGRGRQLTVEVLDTRSAESLARRTLVLSDPLGEPMSISPQRIRQVAATVNNALAGAAAAVLRNAGKKRLATLFFVSRADSERLDGLASRAEAFLEAPDDTGVRIMRFRKAGLVSGEARMAAAEWLEEGARGFYHPADAFAWGSVTEIGNTEAAFPEVEIRIEWNLWDGTGEPRQFAEDCRVAEAGATFTALARRIHEAVRPSGFSEVAGETRRTVASRLFAQAAELYTGPDDRLDPGAVRRWRHRRALFEAAHFFLPEDPVMEAMAMVESGHRTFMETLSVDPSGPMVLRANWDRHDAWGRYVETHGFGPLREAKKLNTRSTSWPIASGYRRTLGKIPPETQFASLSLRLCRMIDYAASSLPRDTPHDVRQGWLKDLVPEYRRRLHLAAESCEEPLDFSLSGNLPVLEMIPDPVLRFRAMAVVWSEIADWNNPRDPWLSRFRTELIASAEEAGLATDALELMREVPGTPPAVEPEESGNGRSGTRFPTSQLPLDELPESIYDWDSWWESRLRKRFDNQAKTSGWFRAPARVFTLDAATAATGNSGGWKDHGWSDRWIESGERRRDLNQGFPYVRVMDMATRGGRLYTVGWSHRGPWVSEFNRETGRFGSFPTPPEIRIERPFTTSSVSAFLAHDTGLWIAQSGYGIWRYDWTQQSWETFGASDGLPSVRFSQGTATPETVYFGTDNRSRSHNAIAAWSPQSGSWRTLVRPGEGNERLGYLRNLQGLANGDLLVCDWIVDERYPARSEQANAVARYFRFTPDTGQWTDLTRFADENGLHTTVPHFDGDRMWSPRRGGLRTGRWNAKEGREVTPAVPELAFAPGGFILATEGDWAWMMVHDYNGEKGFKNPALNGARIFAIHTGEASIRGATCLPVYCRVISATIFEDHFWLCLQRRDHEPATMLVYRLSDLRPDPPK